jgi:malonyl-CoA O-methyltransferase
MQPDLEKRAIRAAFGNAASRYDSVAHVQRRIADALLARCSVTTGIALDVGSGTGYAANRLRALSASSVALDHASPMLSAFEGAAVCGDIEALPVRDASIGLYYSSLAWQWTNTERAIAEAARVLQPGGALAVASLAPGTFKELRHAFRRADDAEHVRQFVPTERYLPQLTAAGFESIEISCAEFVIYASDLRTMLHDIKALGAHVVGQPRRPGLFGVQAFRRAESYYRSLREEAGLPLTYEAVFITARRQATTCATTKYPI